MNRDIWENTIRLTERNINILRVVFLLIVQNPYFKVKPDSERKLIRSLKEITM